MKIRVFSRKGELVGPVESATVVKSDAEWQRRLTPEQYEVARGKGTERTGIPCAGCGARLGRVFEDGPRPSGPRFCVDTESLVFA